MGDTAEECDAVAAAIEAEEPRPVRLEELCRDANSDEACLTGVDISTINVGVLTDCLRHPVAR
jgi:hypothetical protein